MTTTGISQRVGEVIASQTDQIEVQCYQLHAAPPLGTLLRIGTPPVYAVVRFIENAPIDPARPLLPRGASLETEDELYATHPQLPSLLTTRFTATMVGHTEAGRLKVGVPSLPPNLHSFVFACDAADVVPLAQQPGFLKLLLADHSLTADLSLIAALRLAAASLPNPRHFLVAAGKLLACELSSDPFRLRSILREIAL